MIPRSLARAARCHIAPLLLCAGLLGRAPAAQAEPVDALTLGRQPSALLPRPLASLHASAGLGMGSLGVGTAAARLSATPIYWFRPNVGVGLDAEMAGQSTISLFEPSTSHFRYALGVALSARPVHHKPLLLTAVMGGYWGSDRPGADSQVSAGTFGGLLGARLGYLGQIGPAEIGPELSLDGAIRTALPIAFAATLGLKLGFTVSRRGRPDATGG